MTGSGEQKTKLKEVKLLLTETYTFDLALEATHS